MVGHVRGLEAEVDVLKHLDHPNIVRYLARPLARLGVSFNTCPRL